MLTKLIHLLGGYTERDMLRKYLEGRLSQSNLALNAHTCNDALVGAAYKNKLKSELIKQQERAQHEYNDVTRTFPRPIIPHS